MLPSGCLFASGGDFSFLVNLPLIISRLLCGRNGSYLCLHCLQVAFLPWVETLPYWWIYRCSSLVCRVEGVVAIINLPFVAHLLWEKSSSHHRSGCLSFLMLPPSFLSTLGWDRSSFVNLPLPILVCRVEESTTAVVRYESAVLRGWWTVTSRPASEDFALDLLTSSMFYPFKG